ncbi:MAG: metallophosphoesterase [Planctomycetota bacterium]
MNPAAASTHRPAGPRLAVLADIHGNRRALEAVITDLERWQPTLVVVAGDVINRGPYPVECLDRVLELRDASGWAITRGNHEEYVLQCANPPYSPDSIEMQVFRGAHWTFDQLDDVHRASIEELPAQLELRDPAGGAVHITHASATGLVEGIFPWFGPDEISPLIDAESDLFVVAHTHCPLDVTVNSTRVVNVGSVGLPFDRDHRASYGRFTWVDETWQVEIVRLEYDRAAAEADFESSGFLADSGPLAPLVLDEIRSAESRLFQWMEQYYEKVIAGELRPEEAARRFLRSLDR